MAQKPANQSASSNAGKQKTLNDLAGDLKSQLCQQEKSNSKYFVAGTPEDKATAIFTEGSRYFSVTTKSKAVAAGGDPDVWKRLRQTQDRYIHLKAIAEWGDEQLFPEEKK